MMAFHIGRTALVLLSIVTEVQCWFRFKGSDINSRILDCWDGLLLIPEAGEIYENRYKVLMPSKGIKR